MTVKENRMIGTHSQYMGCAFSSDVKENNACAKRNFINGKGNDVIVLSKNGSVLLFSLSPTIEEHPEWDIYHIDLKWNQQTIKYMTYTGYTAYLKNNFSLILKVIKFYIVIFIFNIK